MIATKCILWFIFVRVEETSGSFTCLAVMSEDLSQADLQYCNSLQDNVDFRMQGTDRRMKHIVRMHRKSNDDKSNQ